MLRSVAVAGIGVAVARPLAPSPTSAAPSNWRRTVTAFLEQLSRPGGGCVWREDVEQPHLTATFAVIGSYRALGRRPPNPSQWAEFVRTHHPSRLKKLEQERRVFEFQQVQSLIWLGENASEFHAKVRAWRKPVAYLKQYEQNGHPVFGSEMGAFTCRALLGLPLDDLAPEFIDYLNSRRRANGSFNNVPAAEGGDGHVMNTLWGLQALRALGRAHEQRDDTIAWLRACQLPNGGFTWQPEPAFAGVDDVVYTWAAVRALKLLGATPVRPGACAEYLWSLHNADGGFGDRAGWAGNAMATYHALEALAALDALGLGGERSRPQSNIQARPSLPDDLKVYSIQIEAHGCGSPAEAVDMARALRIYLWGAKNAKPEWIARAQAIAERQRVPVKFFVANEEYGTWVRVPGLGTYSHTSDVMAPAGAEIGPSLQNRGVVTWPEFRERRLEPLQRGGGRLIWQFGENEELTRLLLDDSLERGGYAAISTFHFGNPDFTNSEPFLNRYRGRIPFIALQDAHGAEPWWFADMTTGFRTVFLARTPSWDGWLEALEQNRVVAIRHDAFTGFNTWMHGGSRAVVEFVRQRERSWRWWNNPEIERPLVSLVAVTPHDKFESARPDAGVTLRVRCAWENTTQGLPKKPISELVRLTVDGVETTPTLAQIKAPRGAALEDHYHFVHLPELSPGEHTASAVARVVETRKEVERSVRFVRG